MTSEQKPLKIAFLTSMDPQDKRAWSGILYHTAQALQKYCGEVISISPASMAGKTGGQTVRKKMRIMLKKYFAYSPIFSIGRKYFVCQYRILSARRFVKFARPQLLAQPF